MPFCVSADRGFRLKDDFLTECNAELVIPAFTKGHKQLPGRAVENSRAIASVRIHIERVIGLLKNRYTILKGIMPLRSVKSIAAESHKSNNLANCDKIVQVCSALINMHASIVYKNDAEN